MKHFIDIFLSLFIFQTVAVGVIKSVEAAVGGKGKVTKAAEKASKKK